MITAKTLVNTVLYLYDAEGTMTRKRIIPAVGEAQDIWYENSEDGNTVVKFAAGDRTVTSHSKSDSFGRKEFDELQLGTGFVSRQFSYHAGEKTDEHANRGRLKSSPTTQLVSQIVLSGGRSISYEYDAEERITKVDDSVDGITEYTYDALGQLLIETVNGTVVNTMTYDNYGNIVSKNGVAYTYGDGVWKDLLTKVGEQTITYDAQGNPTSYMGHTLTWEKGRQLKSFDDIQYTYNANGIRTSKTINGVTHTYTLDGTKILRETWTENEVENTIIPLYDNEESVCGICFNGEYFYFQKNLQGDVIAIVDDKADVVAQYAYDAWGVCTIVSDTSACSIATINPYRYRGYYYDNETELYYLRSRYYNSFTARFVNADDPAMAGVVTTISAYNLFSYCYNAPSCYTDSSGFFSLSDLINKITSWGSGICEFLLGQFRISANRYKKRNKYRNKRDIYNFVFENKTKIKKLGRGFDAIQKFLNIITTVVDCASILKNATSEAIEIAGLIFYGLIQMIGFLAEKLIAFLVKKLCIAAFWLNFVIEKLLNWLFDKIFNSNLVQSFIEKVRKNYLKYVNIKQISFSMFIVALFKGVYASL